MKKLYSKLINKIKAFSLVEVLIGIIVLGIISSAFAPVMVRKLNKLSARIKTATGLTEDCSPPFHRACTLCLASHESCIQCNEALLKTTCDADEFTNTKMCKCIKCSTIDPRCVRCKRRFSKGVCTQCEFGYYVHNGKCEEVPAGYYSDDGIDKKDCGKGNYCPGEEDQDEDGIPDGGNTEPIPCTVGHKCPGKNMIYPESCEEGEYQDEEGQEDCKPCTKGHKCPVLSCDPEEDEDCGNINPEPCEPGEFQDSTGQTACKKCTAGHKCPNPAMEEGESCSEGTAQGLEGQIVCYNCDAGQYQNKKSQTACKNCNSNEYTPNDGAAHEECYPCPAGSTCAGGVPSSCPKGTYSIEGQTACKNCDPGTYQDLEGQSVCKSCNSGHACQNSGTKALNGSTKCAAGKYTPPGQEYDNEKKYSLCLNCSAGQYQNSTGQTSCLDCTGNTYSNDGAATCPACSSKTPNCTACDKIGGMCTACGTAYYLNGSNRCETCAMDYYMSSGICTPCSAGTHTPSDNTRTFCDACGDSCAGTCGEGGTCDICSAGYYKPTGGTKCLPCDKGYYQNGTGQTACKACVKGKYCPVTGMKGGRSCLVGQYQDNTGQTACKPCNKGYYQDLEQQSSCKPCEGGYYQNTKGQTACEPCEEGYYQNEEGQSNCKACVKGKYCPVTGMKGGRSCPAGQYSDDLALTACKTCNKGYYQDLEQQSACKECNSGYYCPTVASVSLSMCLAGTYTPNVGHRSECTNCNNGYYCPTNATPAKKSCAIGTYTPDDGRGYSICLNCACGKSSNSDKNGCVTCDGGQYSYAGSACTNSSPGYYAAEDKCSQKKCACGTYRDTEKHIACAECNKGTYAAGQGSTSCTSATKGHYVSENGSCSQSACAAGTYQDSTGQTACKPCGEGYYCNGSGLTTRKRCHVDNVAHCTKCNPSNATCRECSTGYNLNTTTHTCYYRCDSNWQFIDKGSGLCVYKVHNITSSSSVTFVNIQSSCNSTGGTKCCWKATSAVNTSGAGCTGVGCNSTICNWYAANQICTNLGGRLATMAEYQWMIENQQAAADVNMCAQENTGTSTHPAGARCESIESSGYCKGTEFGHCYPQVYFANGTKGSLAQTVGFDELVALPHTIADGGGALSSARGFRCVKDPK